MAPFTPNLAPTNDPNYQYSKAPSRSDIAAATDNSLGTAVRGAGGMLDLAAKGIDTTIKDSIKDDLYSQIDKLRAAQGGETSPGDAASITATARAMKQKEGNPLDLSPAASVPAGVTTDMNNVKRLNAAYSSGTLGNSSYYAQLETMVRSMRAKYPGYRDEIDSMVAGITGVTPANALRSSILQDLNSISASAASRQAKLLTMWRADQQYTGPVSFDQYAANFNKIQAQVAEMKSRDYQVQSQEHEIALANAKDARTSALAEKAYRAKVGNYTSNTVAQTLSQLNQDAIRLKQQGANADPKAMQDFVNRATAIRDQMNNQMIGMATAPLPAYNLPPGAQGPTPSSGKSYMYFVDPKNLKAARDEALQGIDTIVESITGKNTDMASVAANIVKFQQNADYQKMTAAFPAIRGLAGVRRTVGDNAMTEVIQRLNGKPLDALTQAVSNTGIFNIVHKDDNRPPVISDVLKGVNGTNPTNPGLATRSTLEAVHEIAAKSQDPDIANRAVQSIYGDPNFFANVSAGEQGRIFRLLGSPSFTAKMQKLGGDAYNTYSDWMIHNFPGVFKQTIDDLQGFQESQNYNVTFDPSHLSFTVQGKPTTPNANPIGQYAQHIQFDNEINKALELIRPVLQARFGGQAPQVMLKMLQNAGFDYYSPKTQSITQSIIKALTPPESSHDAKGLPVTPVNP